jgi:hypothetical protein
VRRRNVLRLHRNRELKDQLTVELSLGPVNAHDTAISESATMPIHDVSSAFSSSKEHRSIILFRMHAYVMDAFPTRLSLSRGRESERPAWNAIFADGKGERG